MSLNTSQTIRFSRQLIMDEIGLEGQEKLIHSSVLVIGAGGLGSPALAYLAAAGVGKIGIVDYDTVDLSNLQRQILYTINDLGKEKSLIASNRLALLNPDLQVTSWTGKLDEKMALDLFPSFDVVIDATDSFPSKFLVNDMSVLLDKPFVHGAILKMKGQVLTWIPGMACYRCTFNAPPEEGAIPSCQQAGVLGAVAGVIGSIQASEAIKIILGRGELLTNKILTVDLWNMKTRIVNTHPRDNCPAHRVIQQ